MACPWRVHGPRSRSATVELGRYTGHSPGKNSPDRLGELGFAEIRTRFCVRLFLQILGMIGKIYNRSDSSGEYVINLPIH